MTFPFFAQPWGQYQQVPFNPMIILLSEPPTSVSADGTQEWELPEFEAAETPGAPVFIAGYASVTIKDKEEPIAHLVTTGALEKALERFMAPGKEEFRNINLRHSNIQVAKVIDSYHSKKDDMTYTTHVDEAGLFLVCEMRSDIDAARVAIGEVQEGTLNSFSISGEALKAVIVKEPDEEPFLRIDDVELWEITIAEEGKNPAAKFVIVKQLDTDEWEYAKITPSMKEIPSGEGALAIEDFLPYWRHPIRIFREFVCMVGGMAEFGATNDDVDILFRIPHGQLDWTPFEFRIQRAVEGMQRERMNFMYGDQGGPFTSYVPLYDLILVPCLSEGEHIKIELAEPAGRSTRGIRQKFKRSKTLRDVRHQMQKGLAMAYGRMALEMSGFVEDGPKHKGLKNDLRKIARSNVTEMEAALLDGVATSMALGQKIAKDYLKSGDIKRLTKQNDDEEVEGLSIDEEAVQDLADAAVHETSESVVKMVWNVVKRRRSEDLSWTETAKVVKDQLAVLASPEDPLKFVKMGCSYIDLYKGCDCGCDNNVRLHFQKQRPLGPRREPFTEEEIARKKEILSGFTEGQLANRIATIINTVTSDASNFAMLKEFDKAGVVTVKVLDDEFPTSCKICKFKNGLIWTVGYALRRTNRLEHPNCVRKFRPIGIAVEKFQ